MTACSKFVIPFLLVGLLQEVRAQDSLIFADVRLEGGLLSGHVPFWMRANQYGSIPSPNGSASVIGSVHKNYQVEDPPLFDWGAGLEVRANGGSQSDVKIVEGYVKGAFSIFDLRIGRMRSTMGLVDSSLSTGAFTLSGNALGIPKAVLSIYDYYRIPVLSGIFSFKGTFGFGVVGKVPTQYRELDTLDTYVHELSFYGRLGGEKWRTQFYAGINHAVYFGEEKKVWGSQYDLSVFKTAEYVVLGKTWNKSKIGNHIGSIDLGMDYSFDGVRIFLYRQNFYDEGAIAHLANIRDGLNGISLTNTQVSSDAFRWEKVVVEFLCTTNQAGYPFSRKTQSGDEDYYNNYEYTQGWSYKGLGLGNPLMTTRNDIRPGYPQDPKQFFPNNRVLALHLGLTGRYNKLEFTTKLTYSKNKGTFSTSIYGSSTGNQRNPPQYGIFPEVSEFSGYLMVSNTFDNDLKLSCAVAFDKGNLLYNSGGIIVKMAKTFFGNYKRPNMYND